MADYIEGLISVIVPVFNTEKYVGRCLDSIINQTYDKLEIIVVDDGSTDNSYDVCKDYTKKDKRVILLHQENKGVVAARRNGIEHASGEFIAFVDSDDYIEKNMYEEMKSEIGTADLVSCTIIRHISEEKENDAVVYRKDLFNKYTICNEDFYSKMLYDFDENILQRVSPNMYNKLFIHKKVDKFYKNLDEEIVNGEDRLFSICYILECSSIVFLDKPLYHYCFRDNSCVHTLRENELCNVNRLYLNIKDALPNNKIGNCLLKQLQKYIQTRVCLALNKFMDFDPSIRMPLYIMDTDGLKGKKIAIYGAGEVGQDVYWQLNKFDYNIVLRVDKNYMYYQSRGMDIRPIETLLDYDYDVILIAVKKEARSEIKDNLIKLGIDENKIFEYNLKEI